MAHRWGDYQAWGGRREVHGREERGGLKVSLVSPQISNNSFPTVKPCPHNLRPCMSCPHRKCPIQPQSDSRGFLLLVNAFCAETFWKPGAVGSGWAWAMPLNCPRGSRPSPVEISQSLESRTVFFLHLLLLPLDGTLFPPARKPVTSILQTAFIEKHKMT